MKNLIFKLYVAFCALVFVFFWFLNHPIFGILCVILLALFYYFAFSNIVSDKIKALKNETELKLILKMAEFSPSDFTEYVNDAIFYRKEYLYRNGYFANEDKLLTKLENIDAFNVQKTAKKSTLAKNSNNFEKIEQDQISQIFEENENLQEDKDFAPKSKDFKKTNISDSINSRVSLKSEEYFKIKKHKPSKFVKFLKDFFAENLIAKLGGLLIFLSVAILIGYFFTKYESIRLPVIFGISVLLYILGVFISKKGYKGEGMVLLGVSVLINYVLIFTLNKFINLDNFGENVSIIIIISLLIVNSIFSVVTSIIFKSKTLLLFTTIISYLIPFLTTIIFKDNIFQEKIFIYDVLLTLGNYFIIYNFNLYKNQNYNLLQLACIILANLLLFDNYIYSLISVTTGNIDFSKYSYGFDNTYVLYLMISFIAINFLSLIIFYLKKSYNELSFTFVLSNLVLFAILILSFLRFKFGGIDSDEIDFFSTQTGVVFFLVSSLGLFILNSILLVKKNFYVLFLPFIQIFVYYVLYCHDIRLIFFINLMVLFFYIFFFFTSIKKSILSNKIDFYFSVIGWFLIFCNYYLFFNIPVLKENGTEISGILNLFRPEILASKTVLFGYELNSILLVIISVIVCVFTYLFTTYFIAIKRVIGNLYNNGTLISAIMLLLFFFFDNFNSEPGQEIIYSKVYFASILGFAFINFIFPFISKNILKSKSSDLISGNFIGLLFTILFIIFHYDFNFLADNLVGKEIVGYIFMGFSVFYLLGGLILHIILKNKSNLRNSSIISYANYCFLIGIILFSLGILIIFPDNFFIKELLFITESTILLFLASRFKSGFLGAIGSVLMIIGLVYGFMSFHYLGVSYQNSIQSEYEILRNNTLVFAILSQIFIYINYYLIFVRSNLGVKNFIALLYICSFILFYLIFARADLFDFIPDNSRTLFNFNYVLGFVSIVIIIHNFFKDFRFANIIYYFLYVLLIAHFVYTLVKIADPLKTGEYTDFIGTGFVLLLLIFQYFVFKDRNRTKIFAIFFYTFLMLNLLLYLIFETHIVITILFGALALIMLFIGIYKLSDFFRIMGLLFLTLTIVKILSLDILYSDVEPIIKVITFMFMGGFMIFISTFYKKMNMSALIDYKNLFIILTYYLSSEGELVLIENNIENHKKITNDQVEIEENNGDTNKPKKTKSKAKNKIFDDVDVNSGEEK